MDPAQIPLRDLHLPPPVGWWPPAPGWWLLLLGAAVLAGYALWRAWRRWRLSAPRRIALREFRRLGREADGDAVLLARRLSPLLRRAMLAYMPREQVAGLTGRRWLEWLDRGLDEPLFTAGPGRCLASLPYRDPASTDELPATAALLAAVKTRLATPLPEERR